VELTNEPPSSVLTAPTAEPNTVPAKPHTAPVPNIPRSFLNQLRTFPSLSKADPLSRCHLTFKVAVAAREREP
jgi:hypothetical protein